MPPPHVRNVKLVWPLSDESPQRIYSVAACIPSKAPKAYLTETGQASFSCRSGGIFSISARAKPLHRSEGLSGGTIDLLFFGGSNSTFSRPLPIAMLFLHLKNASL